MNQLGHWKKYFKDYNQHHCQVEHTVVLHQDNLTMFALLSVDQHEGSLAIVHRETVITSNTSTQVSNHSVLNQPSHSQWNKLAVFLVGFLLAIASGDLPCDCENLVRLQLC